MSHHNASNRVDPLTVLILCRYNDQMSEVKRELKSCKTKMETQTKQVQEYSQRLEDYDKKFEESSRKFQNMLTVSNLLGWRKRYMSNCN